VQLPGRRSVRSCQGHLSKTLPNEAEKFFGRIEMGTKHHAGSLLGSDTGAVLSVAGVLRQGRLSSFAARDGGDSNANRIATLEDHWGRVIRSNIRFAGIKGT
jgi:hypothetical protein